MAGPLTEMPDMATVHNAIAATLSDSNEGKMAASNWLEALRNSVYAWKVCDELLIAKKTTESCYIAANMLRHKILKQFNELPLEWYTSLKDSLMNHMESISDNGVRNQLSLSLVYLSILLQQWQNPIEDIAARLDVSTSLLNAHINKFDEIPHWLQALQSRTTFADILTLMSEEAGCMSSPIKVGINRREDYEEYLLSRSDQVIDWMLGCLTEMAHVHSEIQKIQQQDAMVFAEMSRMNEKLLGSVYHVYSAWLRWFGPAMALRCLPIIDSAFANLRDLNCVETLHDKAVDAIVATSEMFESGDDHSQLIEHLIEGTYTLEETFSHAVAIEDTSKSINYTRVFTDVAEAACEEHILKRDKLKLVDLVLKCINHYDFDVAEVTFGFWWRFGEEIQNRKKPSDYVKYVPYIQQLIMGLIKLCHCDADEDSVITSSLELDGFRTRVCELIKCVIFVPTAAGFIHNCKLLEMLETSLANGPWERIEAILFLLTCLMDDIEDKYSAQIKERLYTYIIRSQTCHNNDKIDIKIGLENGDHHPQVVDTTCKLLAVMDTFFKQHPHHIQGAIGYMMAVFNQYANYPQLARSSSSALVSVVHECADQYLANNTDLIKIIAEICCNLDRIKCEPAASNILRCCAQLMSCTRLVEIRDECLCRVVKPNIKSLLQLVSTMSPEALARIEANSENQTPGDDDDATDNNDEVKQQAVTPMTYLDRITNLFRDLNIDTPNAASILPNLVQLINTELWPTLLKVLKHFAPATECVIERTCRTLRYLVRSIKPRWMCQLMAVTMVDLYANYPKNSSPLYVGSILVDEFAQLDEQINISLFAMLNRFCELTFTLLQMSGSQSQSLLTMKTYPDTIEDMMRLFRRFAQKCPQEFVSCQAIDSIMELSISSLRLDQRDAHENVVRFLTTFVRLARPLAPPTAHTSSPDCVDSDPLDASTAAATTTSGADNRSSMAIENKSISTINNNNNSSLVPGTPTQSNGTMVEPQVPQVAQALRASLGYRIVDAVIKASIYNLPSYYVLDMADILLELAKFDRQLYGAWCEHVVSGLPETKVQGLVSVTQSQKNELKVSLLESPCDPKRVAAALRYLISLFH